MTTTGRTDENINLEDRFVEIMLATYGGTRIGRQELDGELIADVEGALWTARVDRGSRSTAPPPAGGHLPAASGRTLTASSSASIRRRGSARGATPAGSWSPGAGAGAVCDRADESVRGLSPEGWSTGSRRRRRGGPSLVVAEANNGGAMVESVLKAADAGLKVRLVHASQRQVGAGRAGGAAVRERQGVPVRELSRAGG